MRNLLSTAALASVLGTAAWTGQAQGAIYLVDWGPTFSDTTTTGSSGAWTNINDGEWHTLVTKEGTSPQGSPRLLSQGFSGAAVNAVTSMTGAAAAAFGGDNNNAAADSAYDNSPATPPTITIDSLNSNLKYEFTIFASRNSPGDKIGVYTATGSNSASGELNARENWDKVLVLSEIRPDANNRITLTIAPATGYVGHVYLNAVKIESSPVPEPASFGLLTAAGAGILLRRRRVA